MKKYIGRVVICSLIGIATYIISKKIKQSTRVVKDVGGIENRTKKSVQIKTDIIKNTEESVIKMNEEYNKEISNDTIEELTKQQERNYDLF